MAVDIAAVQQAFYDNADFQESASLAKAQAYRTACRRLMGLQPKMAQYGTQGGGTRLEIDPNVFVKELDRVNDWIATNADTSAGGSGPVMVDLSNFRG